MSTENTPSNARTPWAYTPPSPHKLKIALLPADLPDTLKDSLAPIEPLPDRGRDALPALGGPPLKHEYSDVPYSASTSSFADAVTKQ